MYDFCNEKSCFSASNLFTTAGVGNRDYTSSISASMYIDHFMEQESLCLNILMGKGWHNLGKITIDKL